MADDIPNGGWHLDKRVPIILIITIFIQTGSIIWWAASLSSRVSVLETAIMRDSTQEARIIRNETRVTTIENSLDRIEKKLDRLIERSQP